MSIRCRFGMHDRSKYVPFVGPRQQRPNGKPKLMMGSFVCTRCSK